MGGLWSLSGESITFSYPRGYNLTANYLLRGDNRLNTIFPAVPAETQVLKFANNNYQADIFDGTEWLTAATGVASVTTVLPGQGFFLFNPTGSNLPIEYTGDRVQGLIGVSLPPGFSMAANPVPEPFTPNLPGFPRVLEMQILIYVNDGNGGGSYRSIGICQPDICLDPIEGTPMNETVPVGMGFLVFNPTASSANWIKNYSLQ